MASMTAKQFAKEYEKDVSKELFKYECLKDLDLFVLDNSIRESTVGQLRGHTNEDKWEIFNEVTKCGFRHRIVASYNHQRRVDDEFVKEVLAKGEDPEGLWAFSEVTEGISKKVPDQTSIPVGLLKMKEAGLRNVIFEIDLGNSTYNFKKFTVEDMCRLVEKWVLWAKSNLGSNSKVLVSLRDLPDVMPKKSKRVFHVVDFLARLNLLFGICFEEPRGKSLPEECGSWAKFIRKVMDSANWKGHLLVHVHEKFGLMDATALASLMGGANGIWASVCAEGASIGNASSCVTIINLVRLGNQKVLKTYNCSYLRQAAIRVTEITTGSPPHNKQPIFGTRAADFTFDLNPEDFDIASFFGEKAPVRITSLASPQMILSRLSELFGNSSEFTLEIASKMREMILEDLRSGRKEEYMSKAGLALLFDRSGGSLNEVMRDIITADEAQGPYEKRLLEEIRQRWNEWDLRDAEHNDDMLQYDSFYNGFLAPYFSCYRCFDTKQALQALDMDADGYVDWKEFLVYLKWAFRQYPDVKDANELLDVAFRKGLIPAMRDERMFSKEQRID